MAKVNATKAVVSGQQAAAPVAQQKAKQTVAAVLQSVLDKEGMRQRFDELLGKRAPQFFGSLVSMINNDPNMVNVFANNPLSVIQAALKAASYNLPIDPAMGFAYIIPFKNKGVPTATFLMGYKGMVQLALRTGAYQKMNVVDVREGEMISFDPLTEDYDIKFYDDQKVRASKRIIGYVGYFRLINGFEKLEYWTIDQLNEHEKKFRQGQYQSKGWKQFYESMCRKTVLRDMISHWGLMSIDFQRADAQTVQFAQNIAAGTFDDEETPVTIETPAEEPAQLPEQTAETQQTVPEGTVQEMFGEQIPEGEMVDF
jgi:recombination protein RecT